MSNVSPVPPGYHTATPYLIVGDGAAALEFYRRAFAAELGAVMRTPEGRVGHAEFRIGTSMFMLGEHNDVKPAAHDGKFPAVSIYLHVLDADATQRNAVEAGAREISPVTLKYYGNREGGIEDPFGITWWVATRAEIVSEEELRRRHAEAQRARRADG